MGRGLFGGWAEEDGLAAVDEAGRHLAVLELEEAAEQETQQAAQQAQQGQQAQQKVSLDDLFRWVPTPALLSSVGSPPSFADLLPVPRSRDWLGWAQSVPPCFRAVPAAVTMLQQRQVQHLHCCRGCAASKPLLLACGSGP